MNDRQGVLGQKIPRFDNRTLAEKFGTPDCVVLEFVREDFMGKKAKFEYFKFQRDRQPSGRKHGNKRKISARRSVLPD